MTAGACSTSIRAGSRCHESVEEMTQGGTVKDAKARRAQLAIRCRGDGKTNGGAREAEKGEISLKYCFDHPVVEGFGFRSREWPRLQGKIWGDDGSRVTLRESSRGGCRRGSSEAGEAVTRKTGRREGASVRWEFGDVRARVREMGLEEAEDRGRRLRVGGEEKEREAG